MYMVCETTQKSNASIRRASFLCGAGMGHVRDIFFIANGGKHPFDAWNIKLNAIFG